MGLAAARAADTPNPLAPRVSKADLGLKAYPTSDDSRPSRPQHLCAFGITDAAAPTPLPHSQHPCPSSNTQVTPAASERVAALTNLDRVSILAEALPYMQRFAGKTIVVKYGGAAMKDPTLKVCVLAWHAAAVLCL